MSNRTKTGTAMSGIVNANRVKSVKCDCKKCYHVKRERGALICKYYDIINPNKKSCARYSNGNDYALTDRERQELEARYGKRFMGVKRRG